MYRICTDLLSISCRDKLVGHQNHNRRLYLTSRSSPATQVPYKNLSIMSLDGKMIEKKLRSASPDERKASFQEGESLAVLGYKEELTRNRSLWTLLFQSLAIAAVPYGEGSPLISAIYGGGQLSMFLGWIVVLVLDECIALSLGEFASRYPTSGGPSYWSYRMFLIEELAAA
jgi:hypothetical protein